MPGLLDLDDSPKRLCVVDAKHGAMPRLPGLFALQGVHEVPGHLTPGKGNDRDFSFSGDLVPLQVYACPVCGSVSLQLPPR